LQLARGGSGADLSTEPQQAYAAGFGNQVVVLRKKLKELGCDEHKSIESRARLTTIV